MNNNNVFCVIFVLYIEEFWILSFVANYNICYTYNNIKFLRRAVAIQSQVSSNYHFTYFNYQLQPLASINVIHLHVC